MTDADVTIPVFLTALEAARLSVLIDPAQGIPDLEAVIYTLVDHAHQGVYRPGTWERTWLMQVFGDSWLARVEPDTERTSSGRVVYDRPSAARMETGMAEELEPYDLSITMPVLADMEAALTRAKEAKSGCTWSTRGMTNYDQSIDEGLGDDLKAGMRATHSAWNFNGEVWWDAGEEVFKEDVWVYRALAATRSAATLEDLMRVVNDEFGWE